MTLAGKWKKVEVERILQVAEEMNRMKSKRREAAYTYIEIFLVKSEAFGVYKFLLVTVQYLTLNLGLAYPFHCYACNPAVRPAWRITLS